MLELIRKIFGCWHDPKLDYDATQYEYGEELTQHTLEVEKLADEFVKDEKKEIIGNIVSAVISDKEKALFHTLKKHKILLPVASLNSLNIVLKNSEI